MKTALRLLLAPPIDSDVIGWKSRVIAAGGTVSSGTVLALSRFSKACKAAGLWDKLNRVNLFCGDQLTAALVPLKVGAGSATDTNVNFVSGDYTEATGLTGNGSSKYLNTGLNASTLTTNSTHLAVYNRSSSAVGGGRHIGVSAGIDGFAIVAPFTDGGFYSDQYNFTAGAGRVSVAVSGPYGFLLGSRTSSSSHQIFKNGASVASNTGSGGSIPSLNIFVFAWNLTGSPNTYTSHVLAGYSVGSGMTASEASDYNTIMEAFQDALGRGVQ